MRFTVGLVLVAIFGIPTLWLINALSDSRLEKQGLRKIESFVSSPAVDGVVCIFPNTFMPPHFVEKEGLSKLSNGEICSFNYVPDWAGLLIIENGSSKCFTIINMNISSPICLSRLEAKNRLIITSDGFELRNGAR